MFIVADFSEMKTMVEYRTIIGEPLKNIDIGILIANAGIG